MRPEPRCSTHGRRPPLGPAFPPMSGLPSPRSRPGFGLLKRFALGAPLIVLVDRGDVDGGLLEIKDVGDIIRRAPRSRASPTSSTTSTAGEPQTILVLGSDRRYGDGKAHDPAALGHDHADPARPEQRGDGGDVDPARPEGRRSPATATDKINAAYALGGAELDVADGQASCCEHPDQPRRRGQLRRLPAGGQPARLRLRRRRPPLLQRQRPPPAAGQVRGDRRQARLSEALRRRTRSTTCASATSTPTSSAPPASRTSCARPRTSSGSASFRRPQGAARIFAATRSTDIRSDTAILRLLKLAFESSQAPDPRGPLRATASRRATSSRRRRRSRKHARSSSTPRPRRGRRGARARRRRARRRREEHASRSAKRSPATLPPGVFERPPRRLRTTSPAASTRLPFPLYYPTLRHAAGSRTGRTAPRAYDIYDRGKNRYRAYRLVLYAGYIGQYYGVQGTAGSRRRSSTTPATRSGCAGRKYDLYYDGSRLRMVAWRTAARRLLGLEHAVADADEQADARATRCGRCSWVGG